jgi:hypothetical protein
MSTRQVTRTISIMPIVYMIIMLITAQAATINLPDTGQTKCYDSSGNEITCANTGQDGEDRAGISWPSPRFIVTGQSEECIMDNLTGLMWAKNANLDGATIWADALSDIASLNNSGGLCGYTDWRLPNINEIESLVNPGESSGAAQWLNAQGFTNVQSNHYWSSTTYAVNSSYKWSLNMADGEVYRMEESKAFPLGIWPVRLEESVSFDKSAVWKTGQTATYADNDDGSLKIGVAWPEPRFGDYGNAVIDNLTGLMWTKDPLTPGPSGCNPETYKTWQGALDFISCLNTNNYLDYDDWRLPNSKELRSLTDYSRYSPALPSNHPFPAYRFVGDYWTSTTYAATFPTIGPSYAWVSDVRVGTVYSAAKSSGYYVWPVRSDLWLTVSKSGSGTGTVTSTDGGISCGSNCSKQYILDTTVTLVAAADLGSVFTGWSGACKDSTTGNCAVTMESSKAATGTFITEGTTVFSDVSTPYWAYNYVNAIYNNGITTGCGGGRYCPEDNVTRGQMAAFIIRAKYGENFSYSTTPYFTDVPSTHTFFKYVQKLRDDGITVVSGLYDVNSYVTRGQMAAFLIRPKYGEDFTYTQTPYFSDVPSTNGFFKYVQKLKDEGITAVTGTYDVDSIVTRAQMAAFLARAFLGME